MKTTPKETAAVLELLEAAAYIERRLDRALSNVKGISFSEYRLLAALRDHPGSSASRVDLAESIGFTASGVTRALKPLEKLGIITTSRGERDARQALAVLTDAGQELVTDAAAVVDDMVATLFGGPANGFDRERVAAFFGAGG